MACWVRVRLRASRVLDGEVQRVLAGVWERQFVRKGRNGSWSELGLWRTDTLLAFSPVKARGHPRCVGSVVPDLAVLLGGWASPACSASRRLHRLCVRVCVLCGRSLP